MSASLDERMAFFFMKTDNQKIIEKLKKTDLTVYENLSDLFEMARITNDLDLNEEVMWLSAKEARKGKIEFAELHKKSLLFAAPHRLDAYLMYIEFDREPSKKFYLPRRKVLKVIVDDLQDLEDGKLDFLSISLPPRVGKSRNAYTFYSHSFLFLFFSVLLHKP